MKKYISCLLVLLALLLPMLGMEADAAEIVDSGTCGENVTWVLDSEGTLTISGTGEMFDYDMAYNYAPWRGEFYEINSVMLEDGITHIGAKAFEGCNLTAITIPDSVTTIGRYAFYRCSSLISVSIPDSITSIEPGTFYFCSKLTEITIPDGVTSIGDEVFRECSSLTKITIPDSVVSIGVDAFCACSSLTDVYITDIAAWLNMTCGWRARPADANDLPQRLYLNGELLTDLVVPEGVANIGEYTFKNCTSLTSAIIPGSVSNIDWYSFEGCSGLTRVILGEGITSIDIAAFYGCNSLTSIVIPEGVTGIGQEAFSGCSSLAEVFIPASVSAIDYGAFLGCDNLTDVYYGGSEEQWLAMRLVMLNENLTTANIHYNVAPPLSGRPFADVAADAYYAEPVLWAVNNGITNGLSENTFGPDATCTRGQIVTFLWRANGSPEPASSANPFWDVMENNYFYKAVLWAVEKGITSGMGDGSFAPGAPCTRGQVATFLWRACGQPAPGGSNIFTDITPGAYYYDAVLWAVENGITNGMGNGTFAPDAPCTRGQIVTFLYRAMA